MDLVVALVVAAGAALVGAAAALRVRQPALVGYLLAGLVVGPAGLRLIRDSEGIEAFAQVGVALLLFAIGVEFDLRAVAAVRGAAIFGGVLQLAITTLVFSGLALASRLSLPAAVFLAFLLSLSSTMAALKIMADRGETDTLPGRIVLGMLIVQDLSVIPMTVLLPILSEPPERLVVELGLALGKTALLLLGAYLLALRIVPWALVRVAATRSNELFILTVVSLALGTAVATEALGLSIAFGAFLAGIVVARSVVGHRVLAETLPLRDVFAAVFFVSTGTMIDPRFLVENAALVVGGSLALIAIKAVITATIVRAFGFATSISLAVGVTLAQVGEFSLVLGQLGERAHLLPTGAYPLLLALTLSTVILNAPLQNAVQPTARRLQRLPGVGRWFADPLAVHLRDPGLAQHVVICGFGRVGREVARSLQLREFRYLVVDLNPQLIGRLREEGVPCIYGDAGREEVLRHAGLDRARGLVCTVPDPRATEAVVRAAHGLNRRLDIVARAHDEEQVASLREAGATEVVYPEFEAGLEMVRHVLHRYGVSLLEIQALLQGRRSSQYQRPEGPGQDLM